MAMSTPDTACMLAETNGTLIMNEDSSPFLNLASGVFKSTFAGICFVVVRPGMMRNSENVRETSLRIFATSTSLICIWIAFLKP